MLIISKVFKISFEFHCPFVLDDSVQSVVSFDQGGEWIPLRKPADSLCDATARDPDKVHRVRVQ